MTALTDRERVLRTVSEKAWTQQVLEVARKTGWLAHHSLTSLMRSGKWATALQGAPGLPDLVLVRAPRVLFIELKTQTGQLSEFQQRWLTELKACSGVESYVLRPGDGPRLVELLQRGEE